MEQNDIIVGDYTRLNIFIFLLITIGYYFVKPHVTFSNLGKEGENASVASKQKMTMSLYFLIVLTIQIIISVISIVNRCGGTSSSNVFAAFRLTVIPWVFIFGVMMTMIMMYPGMKSGFSNVLGYMAVSNSANKLLSELLVNPEVETQIDGSQMSEDNKVKMRNTAQSIVQIMGNTSVLINQVVPENFSSFWSSITPLMKPMYKNNPDSPETMSLKHKLLNMSITRDNVGEGSWYFYTGILVILLVQSNVLNYRCDVDPRIMNERYDEYKKERELEEKKKKEENTTVYKMQ